MSVLKVHKIGDLCFDFKMGKDVGIDFYLKYEADKVIEELKADYKEACDRLQTTNLIKDEQIAATRHQKYKRCLAMARWCERKRIDAANYRIPRIKWEFYDKWHNRWLKIAEQFKEAK